MQKVWRRYYLTKIEAGKFQEEWEMMVDAHALCITKSWISSSFLRPFLFFVTCLSTRCQKIQTREIRCVQTCFRILLESMNSTGIPLLFYHPINYWVYNVCQVVNSIHTSCYIAKFCHYILRASPAILQIFKMKTILILHA